MGPGRYALPLLEVTTPYLPLLIPWNRIASDSHHTHSEVFNTVQLLASQGPYLRWTTSLAATTVT